MAFVKVVSGRQPERSGNGLKFVRRVVNGSAERGLVAVSGRGRVAFGGLAGPLEALRQWPAAQDPSEPIQLDFDGVKVVGPSWLDEVLSTRRAEHGDRVECLDRGNATVRASLETLARG